MIAKSGNRFSDKNHAKQNLSGVNLLPLNRMSL
jgi:hypothetical protein